MLREVIRKQRASNQTSRPGGSKPTSRPGGSNQIRKRRGRKIPTARKVSKKGKTGKMSKKKRSRGVNLRWLTASLRTSTGKARSSQEMPYIAKDVCARPFFWQEEIICFW